MGVKLGVSHSDKKVDGRLYIKYQLDALTIIYS